ncbi:MAG: fimbrillin family protein, partial [Tannerellaceae bacterium]|nr:fimbrillin family protein [Tannerellaceae bacterium]
MITNRNRKLQFAAAVLISSAAVLLPSCVREQLIEGGSEDPVEVKFIADTDADAGTRTSADGNFWLTADEIGIYMSASGQPLSSSTIRNGADNRKYRPQTATVAAPLSPATADQSIYFPGNETVDFRAYYPWKATGTGAGDINNYVYPIDLTDQSDPSAIDLLYAVKTDMGNSLTAVNLAFAHRLSKISLHVKKGADIASVDFSAATATISGMPATGDFSLSSAAITAGPAVDLQAKKVPAAATFDASFEALIIPQAASAGRKVVFAAGGNNYEWIIPATAAFEAGKNHIYALTLSSTGVEEEGELVAAIGALTPWFNIDHTATRAIEKILVHAGTFTMGSPATEPYRGSNEDQHSVTLTKDFYIGKYEVTNAQYAAFLNTNGITGVYDG